MQGVARGGAMVIVADIKGDAATHVADRIAQNGAHARAAQIDVSNREPVQPTMKRTPACSIISSACLAASLGLKPSLTTQKTGRPFTPPLPFTSWSAELAPSNESAPSFPSGPLKGNIAPIFSESAESEAAGWNACEAEKGNCASGVKRSVKLLLICPSASTGRIKIGNVAPTSPLAKLLVSVRRSRASPLALT